MGLIIAWTTLGNNTFDIVCFVIPMELRTKWHFSMVTKSESLEIPKFKTLETWEFIIS
jgi:hypothetical protein